jgi:hypothetical protein
MLMDKVFNIGIFNAATQLYVCTEVADLGSDANSKKYGVYFRWLPSTYAVPEVLKILQQSFHKKFAKRYRRWLLLLEFERHNS